MLLIITTTNYFSLQGMLDLVVIFVFLVWSDFIKELAHSFRVWLGKVIPWSGLKSNMLTMIYVDKNIDGVLKDLRRDEKCVADSTLVKVSNGGGVPKEGSPLNISIVNPIEKRPDWPPTEASPFLRDLIERVYVRREYLLRVADIPEDDAVFAYLKTQKEDIKLIKLQFVKEKSKCWYIHSVRLTCSEEEYKKDNLLKDHVRRVTATIRKLIR